MTSISNSILETIGQTPMVRLNKVPGDTKHEFLAKVEYFNPGGSIKDRIAKYMVEAAERRGEIKPGGTIVEATAGNTGMGLALVAAVKGYKCIFVLPEKMSAEKRAMLRAYGAKVVVTPNGLEPNDPMSHYSVAKRIAESTSNCFYANQYHNMDNFDYHYNVTGPELWDQTKGQIDCIVGGVGTGGTISGVGKFLKEKNPNCKVLVVDPIGSIIYDLFKHGKIVTPPGPWKVEGVGEDMLPDNCKLNVYDDCVQITDKAAFQLTRRLIIEEGLCVGPSSGLLLAGAFEYAKKLEKPSKIVVIMPDSGKSYLSKVFNDQWMVENGLMDADAMKTAFNTEVKAADLFKQQEYL